MSDVTINYKGSAIATMSASGTKTLLTEGKYCEDDIEVVYVKPSGGGGEWTTIGLFKGTEMSGDIVIPAGETGLHFKYYMLANKTGITSFTCHSPITSYDGMCSNCSGLKSFKVYGSMINLGTSVFSSCSNLELVEIPYLTGSVYASVFSSDSKLATVDLGNISGFIRTNSFQNCTVLKTIVLRSTSIVTLSNINNFTGTPFNTGGSGGTIYIPKSLYDHLGDGTSSDYQAATNWSTIHGYGTITWAKIEGSVWELS